MTPNTDTDNRIVVNGINGATGEYLMAPEDEAQAAQVAASEPRDKERLSLLRSLFQQSSQPHLGALYDVDLTNLSEAGWAVVFHEHEDSAVKRALDPLVDHRLQQIRNDKIVKILEYRDGETAMQWLVRNGIGIGDIDPEKVPFYILLVGSPFKIPFLFGHLLDAIYGVGRLHFDKVEDYEKYVASVIAYETATTLANSRDVHFFGTRHIADKATRLSAAHLVEPLAGAAPNQLGVLDRLEKSKFRQSYRGHYLRPEESTKDALRNIFSPLNGQPVPSLLFTASHGAGWPMGDPLQNTAQGALICQDYPGPGFGPVHDDQYFGAADLSASTRVSGLVCFHFACFGVGTPQEDRFFHKDGVKPDQIAPEPFFSPLPQALLSHPNGSALGVFGHVERAWPNSIVTTGAGVQLLPFVNALSYILIGNPLGFALKDFNERYAAYSTNLGALLEKKEYGLPVSDSELVATWTSRNDAEAYILFGDPGVRLRTDLLT